MYRTWSYWEWSLNVLTMEMNVHIDNQSFKVIYEQQGQKQWSLQPWGSLVRSQGNRGYSPLLWGRHTGILPPTHHTVSGSGCLLSTYRKQIWSKLRNGLRTITSLQHRKPKVGNYVSSCCTGTNYYYSVYLKYLNMNTQEQQLKITSEWSMQCSNPIY